MMKKLLVSLALLSVVISVKAETFATQPNNAGGKIVLTDEICKDPNGKVYDKLYRAYNYGSAGYTSEGCWYLEDETISVYWVETNQRMRYPIGNFTLAPKYKNKPTSNSSGGYKY